MRLQSSISSTIVLAMLALGCQSVWSPHWGPEGEGARVPPAPVTHSSFLRGRLTPVPEQSESESPVLVYLEPVAAVVGKQSAAPAKTVALRRRGQGLRPNFVLAHRGQLLVFSNQDDVYHSLFSYSEPNAFELGTLALGETQSLRFSAQGVVRFYCSLHESEHGLIFVSPSEYLAVVDSGGEYSLADVPPGRYRLRTWSDAYANFDREITLRPGESAWRQIPLEAKADAE